MADDVASTNMPPDFEPDEDDIVFGQNTNQNYHTWRHVEEQGLNRNIVEKAIRNDLKSRGSSSIKPNQANNFIVNINGKNWQYTAYRIEANKINIGRIHQVP